jgi:hypothetical protein
VADKWKRIKAQEIKKGDTIRTRTGEATVIDVIVNQPLNKRKKCVTLYIDETSGERVKVEVGYNAMVSRRMR